jgi:hypothetical protein
MQERESHERYDGIAKLHVQNDPAKHAGMGVVVDTRLVLTCAHVVNDALGRAQRSTEQPDKDRDKVPVSFPYAKDAKPVLAGVLRWYPIGPDHPSDIAVLELDTAIPGNVGVAKLVPASAKDVEDHPCAVFGLTLKNSGGDSADGTIKAMRPDRTIAIEGTGPAVPFIEPGYSGAGVWDKKLGAVVGMVVSKKESDTLLVAYMIPVSILKRAWPSLLVSEKPKAPNEVREEATLEQGTCCPYPVPIAMPQRFEDRDLETRAIEVFLQRADKRLLVVEGRAGQGKTALVCRVLETLRHKTIHDSGGLSI